MAERRELKFESWEDVAQELRGLLQGYQQHGQWDLEQTTRHLNDWLTYPIDGFPVAPWPVRSMMALVRVTMGGSMLRKILTTGKMKDGMPTAPETVYEKSPTEDAQGAINALRSTIDRFQQHSGAIHRSPIFGAMDKDTACKLQWVHFAHHLSWLSPLESEAAS